MYERIVVSDDEFVSTIHNSEIVTVTRECLDILENTYLNLWDVEHDYNEQQEYIKSYNSVFSNDEIIEKLNKSYYPVIKDKPIIEKVKLTSFFPSYNSLSKFY